MNKPGAKRARGYQMGRRAASTDETRQRIIDATVELFLQQWYDEITMNQAGARLLGEHDFAAFCRSREGATTVRALQRLEWTRDEPDLLVAHVAADAFCHSMVRSLVGALLAVGEGRRSVEWPAALLHRSTRASEVMVAPAHGLALVAVDYPTDDQLAARAQQTRALRTVDSP